MAKDIVSDIEGEGTYAALTKVIPEEIQFLPVAGSKPSGGTPNEMPRLRLIPRHLANAALSTELGINATSRRQDNLVAVVNLGMNTDFAGGLDNTVMGLSGMSGIYSGRVSYARANAGVNTTPYGIGMTFTTVGTSTAAAISNVSALTRFPRVEQLNNTAAATAIAGIRDSNVNLIWTSGNSCYVSLVGGQVTGKAVATKRFFMGLRSVVVAPTDVNPSTILNMIGVGHDSGDLFYQIMYNNGTGGGATKVNTGLPVGNTDRSDIVHFEMYKSGRKIYFLVNVNGGTFVHTVEDYIADPKAMTNVTLAYCMYASVGGTSSVVGTVFGSRWIEDLTIDSFRIA